MSFLLRGRDLNVACSAWLSSAVGKEETSEEVKDEVSRREFQLDMDSIMKWCRDQSKELGATKIEEFLADERSQELDTEEKVLALMTISCAEGVVFGAVAERNRQKRVSEGDED